MANDFRVSVIIPVYNQQDLVIRALNSVPNRKDVEIIIIDDYSTDNTYNYIKQYINQTNQHITLLKNIENKGVGFTVNRGYDIAKGDYVVLLGSDDYFYPEAFERAMECLDNTDLIYFNLELNDGFIWKLNDNTKYDYCGSTKFIRREFLDNIRNPEKRAREDWDFYHKLMDKKPSEKFTDLIVKHYNFPREGSLTWVACNEFR